MSMSICVLQSTNLLRILLTITAADFFHQIEWHDLHLDRAAADHDEIIRMAQEEAREKEGEEEEKKKRVELDDKRDVGMLKQRAV